MAERTRLSDRPVFAARRISLPSASPIAPVRETLATLDASYVSQQITRMEVAIEHDPALAIGTAKELVETCCKTILQERGECVPSNVDVPQLVKLTMKQLKLTPEDIPNGDRGSDSVRRILGSLSTITQGVAEIRNLFGTGHGRIAGSEGLTSIHAKLVVGAASSVAVFLLETHRNGTRR